MKFDAENVDLGTRAPTVILNGSDAEELGVNPLDRIQIHWNGETHIGIVEVTDEIVAEGTLGVTRRLGHIDGAVDVTHAPKPGSVHYIKKKLNGVELEADDLRTIIEDIDQDRLSDIELSAYVAGIYSEGLSFEETKNLTEAMTEVGDVIEWNNDVIADKHSIGGVAGNRVTPIVVPIVAAAGVTIPKTSSRAITSPAGTADTMEVFCDVAFDLDELKSIVGETDGCLAWGGALDISPVDDKIIRAENPLSLDPPGQVIASVLSKKESAGSTHVVIDVPYGEGAKVESLASARELAWDFKQVGAHFGMEIECTITRGEQPIGHGIGPILEARDVLEVLQGGGPESLRLKSLRLAHILLESCGVEESAREILDSGRALERFRDIVAAQNGDPDVATEDLVPGDETLTVRAERDGVVTHVDNRLISDIARRAGAPTDQGAGIQLQVDVGEPVAADDPLFRVHAEQAPKLDDAETLVDKSEPIRVRDRGEALVERL
ncbi:MAG: AMP phosphorylase [Halobacteriales archaeon]|jgi:AMP phosphorylase